VERLCGALRLRPPKRLRNIGALAALAVASTVAAPALAAEAPPTAEMATLVQEARRGLAPALPDAALSSAAGRYAEELAARGVLSHTGEGGEGVADRACRAGCTDARLGEVLGAGADPRAVVAAWLASPAHREVLLGPDWTSFGVGTAGQTGRRVYVVLFSVRRIVELRVEGRGAGLLRGRIVSRDAAEPVLVVGLDRSLPSSWDPLTGAFAFPFDPAWVGSEYLRLGYVSVGGSLVVTNVLRAGSRLPGSDPGD
jgi:hypothetical protein